MELYRAWSPQSNGALSFGCNMRFERQVAVPFAPGFVSFLGEMRQIIGGDVTGDVIPVEAGRFELLDPWVRGTNRRFEPREILVDQEIRADLTRDLRFGASGGDQLALVRHVDAVDVRVTHRRT